MSKKLVFLIPIFTVLACTAEAELATQFFDPAWNIENRWIILSVIITVLFLSGLGLPLPEDIPLTISGFTTTKFFNDEFIFPGFAATFIIVVIPILIGDLGAYIMGRKLGLDLRHRSKFIGRIITDKRLEKVQRWFGEYGSFAVFLGRQVAGVRFVTFFTAGAARMMPVKFVFFDFLGCLVSVPVWLSLGYFAAIYGRKWLDEASRTVSTAFLIGTAVAVLLFIAFIKLRSRRRHIGN